MVFNATVIGLIVVLSIAFYILIRIQHKNLYKTLAEEIGKSIVELNPKRRYILSFGANLEDDEFDTFAESLQAYLGLDEADTKVVVTNSDIKIIEFE